MIFLWSYIAISFIILIGFVISLGYEDYKRDIGLIQNRGKFGYNLRKDGDKDGRFTLFYGFVPFVLFLYLPFVNLIWIKVFAEQSYYWIKRKIK